MNKNDIVKVVRYHDSYNNREGTVIEANKDELLVDFDYATTKLDRQWFNKDNLELVVTAKELEELESAKYLQEQQMAEPKVNKFKPGDTIRFNCPGQDIDGAVGKVYFANDTITCVDFKGDKGMNTVTVEPENLSDFELVESGTRKEEYDLDQPIFYFLATMAAYCFIRLIWGLISIAASDPSIALSQQESDAQVAVTFIHVIIWATIMGCLFGYDNHYSNKKIGADGLPLQKWTCQICGQETDRPMAICDKHAIDELCKSAGIWHTTNESYTAPYILKPLIIEDGKQVYTGIYYFKSEHDRNRISNAWGFFCKHMEKQYQPVRYRIASNIAMAMTGVGLLFVALIIWGYLSSVEMERKQQEEMERKNRQYRLDKMFEDKGGMNNYGSQPFK